MEKGKKQYELAIYTREWRQVYVDANDEQEACELVESWSGVLKIDSLRELHPGDYEWRSEEDSLREVDSTARIKSHQQ